MWLCLSKQKGELTWSHFFLSAGFVVCVSEGSEFNIQWWRVATERTLTCKWKLLYFGWLRTWPILGLPNAQECDHLSSHFWFEKQSHVTRVVNFWRQNQLSLVSLNSRSTCFGSINSQFHCLQIKQTSARIFCIFGSTESCLSTGDVPGNSFHKNLIFLKNWVQMIEIEIRRFGKKM